MLCRLYRVIVEKVTSGRHGRVMRSTQQQPCGLTDGELTNYKTATGRGVACYIAAEIVIVDDKDDEPFIVGDGKKYGGYYNAPLQRDASYRVWLGFIVTVDGVRHCIIVMISK